MVGGNLSRQEHFIISYARWVLPAITLLNTLPYVLANVLLFDKHLPYLRFCCTIVWTVLSVPPAIYADKKVIALVFKHFSATTGSSNDGRIPVIENGPGDSPLGDSPLSDGPRRGSFSPSPLGNSQLSDTINDGPRRGLFLPPSPAAASTSNGTQIEAYATSIPITAIADDGIAIEKKRHLDSFLAQASKVKELRRLKIKAVEKRLRMLINITQISGLFLILCNILAEFVFRPSMSGIYGIQCGIVGFCHLVVALYSEILLDSLNEIKEIKSKGLNTLMMSTGFVGTEKGIASSGVTPSEVGNRGSPIRAFRPPRSRGEDQLEVMIPESEKNRWIINADLPTLAVPSQNDRKSALATSFKG
jgi:hypothetical protein